MLKSPISWRGLKLHIPIQQCGQPDIELKAKILSHERNLKLSQVAGWCWGSQEEQHLPETWNQVGYQKPLPSVWRQCFTNNAIEDKYFDQHLMGHFSGFLQVLKDQMKDKQQGPISSEEVVDVGDHWWCSESIPLNGPGTAIAGVSCTGTNVPRDKFDALHTEIDASPLESNLSSLQSHSIYWIRVTTYWIKNFTCSSHHTINQPKMELSALYAKNSFIMP